MVKKIFLLLVLCFCSVANSQEQDASITAQLSNAKFVGLCGAFRQMAIFQENTKLEGGDNFMERFLFAETARLGQNPVDFALQCTRSIDTYNKFIALISEAEGLPNPNQ